MKSQIKECLEADQAIFIVIGQAKAKERGAISILMELLVIGLDDMMVMMMVIIIN